MLDVGTTIKYGSEVYEVVELIDEGGFGKVFKAVRNTPTKLSVAVKVPAAHILAHPIWRRKFERESRILANIDHPNVVKVLHFWKFGAGEMAIVQELVEGGEDLLKHFGKPDARELSVMLQVLYGLRVTHGVSADARAIHRDLSPRNILVDAEGIAKIIDFGLAKEDPRATTILTTTGEWFGTPGCMAPEQVVEAASVDHRADLFALGRSIASALQQRNPQHADPDKLDEPWRSICLRLTEYEPQERFPDAETAICQVLHDFLSFGYSPEDPEIHFREFSEWEDVPPEWAQVCASYFLIPPQLDTHHLALAYLVTTATLSHHEFPASEILDKLDSGPIEEEFESGNAPFEACDPLGKMLARWYPFLEVPFKQQCFRRLCRTAVFYHRYSVMSKVRTTYSKESNPDIQEELVAILNEEDTSGVIERRGVIPVASDHGEYL